MRVNIETIKETIERLEELVAEMEVKGKTEIRTEGNTYFCGPNFISYGSNGFLDIDNAIESLYSNEETEE